MTIPCGHYYQTNKTMIQDTPTSWEKEFSDFWWNQPAAPTKSQEYEAVKAFIARQIVEAERRTKERIAVQFQQRIKAYEVKACEVANYPRYDEVNMATRLPSEVSRVVITLMDTRRDLLAILTSLDQPEEPKP